MKDSKDASSLTDEARGPIQTSFRLRPDLYWRFRTTLDQRNRKMTSVIQELVEDWLDDPPSSRRIQYLRPYLSWLPMAAVVKDLSGRVLFGNGEFLKLIGPQDGSIVGRLPRDYVKDRKSAELITKLDEVVRNEGRPILCIEHLPFEGRIHHRAVIRFPIPPGRDLELTGVLGFDLEQVEHVTASLRPESNNKRLCEFSTEISTTPESPIHCLKDFLHSLPAIATVKNLDGRLLCVNSEYTRVLGKHRSDVENRYSNQIWDRSFADVIMAHDEVVRRTGQTFASVESVPTLQGLRNRLNFRFPIFGSNRKLEMTGTLGFDYDVMRQGLDLLRVPGPPARAYLFLPPNDRESLKPIYSAS